jgi:transposase-like protein
MAERRYQAVLAVISDGATVTEVAARFGVARKTVHDWLAKYEAGGLENLGDRLDDRPAVRVPRLAGDDAGGVAMCTTPHTSRHRRLELGLPRSRIDAAAAGRWRGRGYGARGV